MLRYKSCSLCRFYLVVTVVVGVGMISDAKFTGNLPDRNGDPNSTLLLTPLIDAGQLYRARTLSLVRNVPGMNRESYSGFLTARPNDEAHFFFWFFPAHANPSSAPVLLWLNGGPGASSLAGLFAESGPYTVTPDLHLKYREDNWATIFNMVYVDCPVGTGYSFAKSVDVYSNSSKAIGDDLLKVVTQFFILFNEYANQDFYIVGESYGVKYSAWLAKFIHERNIATASQMINLKGIVSVSGFINPYELSKGFADYLYQVGLFGPDQYQFAKWIEKKFRDTVQNDTSLAADILFAYLVGSASENNVSFLTNSSGITRGENILLTENPRVFEDFQKFVKLPAVKQAMHVGSDSEFVQYTGDVMTTLSGDRISNVTDLFEELLVIGYKVLMMSGNLDMFISPVSYHDIALGLQWNHTESFRRSRRIIWKVDPHDVNVAGYSHCAFNLCLVLVRNAGHRLANDQVGSSLDAVRRFVYNIPFN